MNTVFEQQHIRSRSSFARSSRPSTVRRYSQKIILSNAHKFKVIQANHSATVDKQELWEDDTPNKSTKISEYLSQFNILQCIFASNLIISLVLIYIIFVQTLGFSFFALNSESRTIPYGLQSNFFIEEPSSPIEIDNLQSIEVDHSQFTALEVDTYTIQAGDTLGQIAIDNGLAMDTIISFNQIQSARRLQIGDELQIPNKDGLLHQVKNGDSLESLAQSYNSSLNAILDANNLTSDILNNGDALFIPGARLDNTSLRLVLGELFIYPTSGYYTSGFGYRNDPITGAWRFHNGVDWANSAGTRIRAAMDGRVVFVEGSAHNSNYGRYIIIQHAAGFQTLYAHLQEIWVRRNEYVYQGESIGSMGNTGRSTGAHLHFSIIRNGSFVDPLAYLGQI